MIVSQPGMVVKQSGTLCRRREIERIVRWIGNNSRLCGFYIGEIPESLLEWLHRLTRLVPRNDWAKP